jgi:hypothetical protein
VEDKTAGVRLWLFFSQSFGPPPSRPEVKGISAPYLIANFESFSPERKEILAGD